jgi:thiol-disulfide isomerase/thioredoxin
MSYILFYSNRCPHCAKFIGYLEESGNSYFFNKVCVDKDRSGRRPPIMKKFRIKEVPSIVIEGSVLSDLVAFKWLSGKIENTKITSKGPHITTNQLVQMPSRQNKLEQNVNVTNANRENGNVLQAFDQTNCFVDNCVSIDDNGYRYSGINTPDETGEIIGKETNFIMRDDQLNPQINIENDKRLKITPKKDALKSKQFDNEYSKLMAERGKFK